VYRILPGNILFPGFFLPENLEKIISYLYQYIVAGGQKTTKYENHPLNLSVIGYSLKSNIIKIIGSIFFCLQFEISLL